MPRRTLPAVLRSSPRSRFRSLDAIGFGLVVALALWVGLVAGDGEGRPTPVLWLLAGLVAATAVGRVLGRRPGLVPGLVAVSVAGSMVLTWPGVLRAGGAPLGYANGNATLASLGLVAALAAARFAPDAGGRRGWFGLALFLAVLTVATGSLAGVLALSLALGLVGLSAVTRWPGFAVVGGLIAVSLSLGITTAIALGSDVGGLGERAETRGELWTAAADFAVDEPLRGIGPGQFAVRNPVSSDADLRWAHHGYLQVAAEYGLLGLLLVVAVIGWVWATLWSTAVHRPASASLTAAAVTIVGLHAAVDYVWHLPPVLVVMFTLFGAGTSSTPQGDASTSWSMATPGAPGWHGAGPAASRDGRRLIVGAPLESGRPGANIGAARR